MSESDYAPKGKPATAKHKTRSKPAPKPKRPSAAANQPASAAKGAAEPLRTVTVAPQREVEAPGKAFGEAERSILETQEWMQIVGEVLVPAFRRAVDALDAAAALALAQRCAEGVRAVVDGRDRARSRTRDADPALRARSESGKETDASSVPPATWEFDVHKELEASVDLLHREVQAFGKRVATDMSPQIFRGVVVGDSVRLPPGAEASPFDVVVREGSTVVDLVITCNHIRDLLGPFPALADRASKQAAVSRVEMWKSRPINFQFLKRLMRDEGLWDALTTQQGESERSLAATDRAVHAQETATGGFGDVGAWDAARADSLLSRGITDWAVTDEDAEKVFDMIASAAPATRGGLVLQLARTGKLARLCDNLPWRYVQQLHDVVDDPAARAKLRPHFEDKGGGESLSKVYERKIMQNIEDDRLGRAYLWTLLNTAHSALTFGFKDVHDASYDAAQEGWISSDAYWSTTAKGVGRAVALMAVTAATGGASGAWGEGVAAGLGAGKTTAQVIGGTFGGGVSGVSGQFTGDVYDQALMGKEGFSSARDYAVAGATGAGTGAATSGLTAGMVAGSKYLAGSAKTMSQIYAQRYPGLDNTLTRIRNAGIREGLVLRVTAQELELLASSGLAHPASVTDALARMRTVADNERIDVNTRTLAKVHPQSEIQMFYGDVDPTTGHVHVRNQNPSSAGYVADAEHFAGGTRRSDKAVREALGIDTEADYYVKYDKPDDPLFEVRFKVSVELDVPLPQTEAPGTPLGTPNPESHHVAGAGRTKGGVAEGKLPPGGAPIEIVDIRPVGAPRAAYPPVVGPYGPRPPATPSVRNLAAPLSGATAGMAADVDASAPACAMQHEEER